MVLVWQRLLATDSSGGRAHVACLLINTRPRLSRPARLGPLAFGFLVRAVLKDSPKVNTRRVYVGVLLARALKLVGAGAGAGAGSVAVGVLCCTDHD